MNSISKATTTRLSIAMSAMMLLGSAASFSAQAENWAQWRGPAQNGTSP